MVKFRVYLRSVKLEDAHLVSRWYNDPEVRQYMGTAVRGYIHHPRDIRKEFKENNPKEERWFMVCLKSSHKPIGQAGIDELDFLDKRGEIFFLIGDKAERGKGYGKESVQLLLDYAFNKLRLHSLFATVTPHNKSSLKVIQKFGFKKVGVRREYNNYNGKYVDEILFDLLDREWKKKH